MLSRIIEHYYQLCVNIDQTIFIKGDWHIGLNDSYHLVYKWPLSGLKMGLVDCVFREPQQNPAKISTYDEKFIISKLDAIKHSAKRFLINGENGIHFALQKNHEIEVTLNNSDYDKTFAEFAKRIEEVNNNTPTKADSSTENNLISIPSQNN